MPQSIYDNGGMIGVTLDFDDTDNYPASIDYNNAVSATSGGIPTFRWSLDGNINEAGGHATTEAGTASYTTGLISSIASQSADFDGSYNIDIANSASINSANTGGTYSFSKRSMSFWFNADSTTGYKAIWEQGGGVNWVVIYLEGGLLYANIGEASVTGGHATASVSSGQTYHCLVTVDLTLGSNQIKIYLNGALAGQATSTVGTDLTDHSGDVNIGLSNSRNHLSENGIFTNYNGRIQDFCYWFEEALTLSDAQSIYAAGIAPIGNQKNSGIWSLSSVLESIETPDSYEFIGAFEDIGNLASYTFSSIDIGQTGLVVLSVGAEAFGTTNPQVVSVNVNGTNASGISETINNVRQSIWYIEELSTTTINVTVTFESAEINRMTLGVWRLDSYSSTIPNIYTDTGVDATRSITTATFPAGSVVIAGATEGQQGITTWTGVDKDYNTTTSEDFSTFSGGSIQLSSEQALAVSATFSATGQNNSLMVAVWS